MEPLRPADPRAIGRYQLLARLGSGGMGEVFLGLAPDGRHVAVKVIRADFDGAEALARFRHEVETVAALRSRRTAALDAADLDQKPYWLATEYIPGPTLATLIAAGGALDAGTTLRLAAGLAAAVADVHAQNVLHRDLKPHNVILAADGPRLIDFGIARGAEQTALTMAGSMVGTPGYLAPELIQGGAATPASDVFALGALLAFAATGRPPFGGGDPQAVLFRTVGQPLDLSGVDPHVAKVVEWCAAKDPAARPGAAEFLAALGVGPDELPATGFYQNLATLAHIPPPSVQAAETAGLRTPGPTPPPFPAPPAQNPAIPGRRRGRTVAAVAGGVAAVLAIALAVKYLPGNGGSGTHGAQSPGSGPTATPAAHGSTAAGPGGATSGTPAANHSGSDIVFDDHDFEHAWSSATDSCGPVRYAETPAVTWETGVPRTNTTGPVPSGSPLEITWWQKFGHDASYQVFPVIIPGGDLGNMVAYRYRGKPKAQTDDHAVKFDFPADFTDASRGPSDMIAANRMTLAGAGDWTVLWFHLKDDGTAALFRCEGFTVK